MPKPRQTKPVKKPRQPATAGGLLKVTLYLHPDEYAAVEQLARRQRSSLAAAVRSLIRQAAGIED